MGTQHQDVIEINGKKYDAVTGKLLTGAQNSNAQPEKVKNSLVKTGVALDGFVRNNNQVVKDLSPAHKKVKHLSTERKVSNHDKHVQKSHTLMRNVVHKPAAITKPASESSNKSVIVKPSLKPSLTLQHAAATVRKNPLVSRYGDLMHRSSVIKKIQDLPVKNHTQHNDANIQDTQSENTEATDSSHSAARSTRSLATSVMIEKALASATTHENPQLPPPETKKRRRLAHKLGVSARTIGVSSSVLAGVLLGGFFAVQNIPNLSMRVAAARAGFNASMPGYNPSGFSFKGPINYSPGVVTISFHSNTDDRAYTVTQRSSNWNSDALLDNFVASSKKQYQTYSDRGRTLYIYDDSSATWMDNGVWYQVEGNSDMTTDQLVRIAASI